MDEVLDKTPVRENERGAVAVGLRDTEEVTETEGVSEDEALVETEDSVVFVCVFEAVGDKVVISDID